MNNKISVLLSEEQIDERIAELGAQISKDYEGEEVFLVCTLKGACFFAIWESNSEFNKLESAA